MGNSSPLGLNVLPHIPDRFEEGYGINAESVDALKLKIPDLKLIITVDNGIVGYDGIKKAKKLGIDVIVIDHHVEGKKKNLAFSIIHSTLVSGSALTWFFSRELEKIASIRYKSSNLVLSWRPSERLRTQLPLLELTGRLLNMVWRN